MTIVDQCERLLEARPSPVVALNHAAAIAIAENELTGLALMEPLAVALAAYQPFHAARAELLARVGLRLDAAESFRRALACPINEVERRHLQRRLDETENS